MMMRNLVMAGCSLLMLAGGPPAPDEPQAAIRAAAERLRFAILQRDKTALEALLHPDYRILPHGARRGLSSESGKAQAIAYYTDRTFLTLKCQPTCVRVFGDAAIETGSLCATIWEHNSRSIWQDVRYTRLWVRDEKGWNVAHEHY
jgi:ketosteroid isomerase-like protein